MTSTEANPNEPKTSEPAPSNATKSSEVVLEQWTIDLLESVAKDEGFVDFTLEHSSGSNIGDGFMGIMQRVLIRGRRNGRQEVHPVMLKMPPTNKVRQQQFKSAVLFEREIKMYQHVLPLFVEFQQSHGLTPEGEVGFFGFPKCYATVCEPELNRFALVMEDLRAKNYAMFDKLKSIDMNHCQLIMEELAKYHAVSFALHDQRPETFEQFYTLEDVFVEHMIKGNKEMMQTFYDFALDRVVNSLDDDETELKTLIRKVNGNLAEQLDTCVTLRPDRRATSVINHGDCWNNNMMYLYLDAVSNYICIVQNMLNMNHIMFR